MFNIEIIIVVKQKECKKPKTKSHLGIHGQDKAAKRNETGKKISD